MKKNEIKAVKFLGKYAQNKGLFNEVIKTLDWLDKDKKKNKAVYNNKPDPVISIKTYEIDANGKRVLKEVKQ